MVHHQHTPQEDIFVEVYKNQAYIIFKYMSDEKDLLKEFITGGWIVAAIGGLGMLARSILDNVERSYIENLKRICAAILCSIIAWFVLEQVEVSSLCRAISYGVVGVVSPELMNGIVKLGKRFSKKPETIIK
jgi:hypothetical protein